MVADAAVSAVKLGLGPSPWLLGEALRRTDEWDKFYPIRLSVTRVARW